MTPDHADPSSAHAVRRRHLNREAALMATGMCFVLASLLAIPYTIIAVWYQACVGSALSAVIVLLVLVSAITFVSYLGRGLQRLQNWARLTVLAIGAISLTGAVAACLVCVAQPGSLPNLSMQGIGTAISGGLVAVLLTTGRTAAYVCTREYGEIVTRTAPDFFVVGRAVVMSVLLLALCGIIGAAFN